MKRIWDIFINKNKKPDKTKSSKSHTGYNINISDVKINNIKYNENNDE